MNTIQPQTTLFNRVKSVLPFKKNKGKKAVITLKELASKGSNLSLSKLFSYAQNRSASTSSVDTIVQPADNSGNPVNMSSDITFDSSSDIEIDPYLHVNFDKMLVFASEEIHFAEHSYNTNYYEEDKKTAEEAVQNLVTHYNETLRDLGSSVAATVFQKDFEEAVYFKIRAVRDLPTEFKSYYS